MNVMNTRSVSQLLLAAAIALAGAVHAAPQARWSYTEIAPIASIGSATPTAINNRGEVVGYSTAFDPSQGTSVRAFLWDSGVTQDLGRISTISPFSFARDINDRGEIVGGDGMGNAYVWRDGTWTWLGFPGQANFINKSGVVGGTYSPDNVNLHGVIFRDGAMVDVGTFGGSFSQVEGINDKAVAVGRASYADNSIHPFIYQDGALKDLGTFGGRFGVALDVNSHGVIVGAAADSSNQVHAFIDDGVMRELLPGAALQSQASRINDHGTVIGNFSGGASFIYDSGTLTMVSDIPAMQGFTNVVLVDINDRGWITGYGRKAGVLNQVAFVLMPK
jgi:probable HAF family extracellular repeat protein